jgi:DNA-binding beta-propeller fold protein YncE
LRPILFLFASLLLTPAAYASDSPLLLASWGGHGSGPGQFDHPRDVAIAPNGNVYVVDRGNNRVEYFTSAGAYVGEWGVSGSAPGQFQTPQAIAIDKDGDVYVSDAADRVQKFTAAGAYLMSFTDPQIAAPRGVAVDLDGNLYVGNGYPYHLLKFDASGQFLMSFTSQLSNGLSLECDGQGSIFVNGGRLHMQRFSSEGALLAYTPGLADPEAGSQGLSVDPQGNVEFVSTYLGYPDEILVWSNDFLKQLDKWLPPKPQGAAAPSIADLAAGPNGEMYLADFANDLILKVQYTAPVPTVTLTWGSLKATYR